MERAAYIAGAGSGSTALVILGTGNDPHNPNSFSFPSLSTVHRFYRKNCTDNSRSGHGLWAPNLSCTFSYLYPPTFFLATIGFLPGSINFVASESGATFENPLHGTLIVDATDMHAKKYICKSGDASRPYRIIGGEDGEGLADVIDLSSTAAIEEELNVHAVHLHSALDSPSLDYDDVRRQHLRNFLDEKDAVLEEKYYVWWRWWAGWDLESGQPSGSC
jgi:hypothetical protein